MVLCPLRIPGYRPTHSNNMRPPVPGYAPKRKGPH
jgi:hypothetical protein